MKKLAFSVIAVVLLLSACKKDDKTTAASSFKLDSNAAVVTSFGFIEDYGTDGNDITFADINPAADSNFTGKVSFLQFSLATLTPGTYTYLKEDSSAYDATKNFHYAECYYKANISKGTIDGNTGTHPGEPTGGSITMNKEGDIYTFEYAIEFGTSKVTGRYVGKPSYSKEN